MIPIAEQQPEPGQYITAEIEYSGKREIVKGKTNPNDPTVVFYDFYSGMGASEIINWEPRTPSFEPGHPYTSIERGEPAIEPIATPDPKDERIAYLERALEQAIPELNFRKHTQLNEKRGSRYVFEFGIDKTRFAELVCGPDGDGWFLSSTTLLTRGEDVDSVEHGIQTANRWWREWWMSAFGPDLARYLQEKQNG